MTKFNPTRLLLAAIVLCAMAQGAAAVAVPAVVGEASLVIGVAHVASADGVLRTVARGTLVRQGDRIETDAGGHVHLRFVDGARLSVRPSSRLSIENYAHSEQQPELNAIRFRLDVGVVRSITGTWGEAARDRFRLNTPVAAIGVKGTDFIAWSDADKTLASVFTGAIVVAPLSSNGCATSLGPCQSGREKLLSETMKGQMIALYNRDTTPQIVALAESMSASRAPASAQSARTATSDSASSDKAANNQALVTLVTGNPGKATSGLTNTSPPFAQLRWARMPWAVALPEDTLSQALEQATASGRASTVGNGAYSLYRYNPVGAQFAATEASAQFRLTGGTGMLSAEQGRKIEAVTVSGGALNVDFARATFDTRVNISSPRLGTDTVTANGLVRPNGFMLGQGGNAYVAGALSLDGKEAGYFFDKALPAGNVSGITVWGR